MSGDRLLVRMIAGGFIALAGIALLGALLLVWAHRPVPEIFKLTIAGAMGSLGTFLVSTRSPAIEDTTPPVVPSAPAQRARGVGPPPLTFQQPDD